MAQLAHLLAATDLTGRPVYPLQRAMRLRAESDCQVTVLNVVEHGLTPSVTERRRADALSELETWERSLTEAAQPRVSVNVVVGDPFAVILDVLRAQQADLAVIGGPGRRGLKELLTGTTAERVVRVRRSARADGQSASERALQACPCSDGFLTRRQARPRAGLPHRSRNRDPARPCLIAVLAIAAAMLPALSSPAQAAGGAFVVDDSEVGKLGECKVESWASFASNADFLGVTSPSCVGNLGRPVELGLSLARFRSNGEWGSELLLKGKTSILQAETGTLGLAFSGGVALGRNHMLLATWTLAYWALLLATRWIQGEAVWRGAMRWVMAGLAILGSGLLGITGTLGGHLVGIYTEVSELLRLLGWEVYTTFYVPNVTLVLILIAAVILTAIGILGRRRLVV